MCGDNDDEILLSLSVGIFWGVANGILLINIFLGGVNDEKVSFCGPFMKILIGNFFNF